MFFALCCHLLHLRLKSLFVICVNQVVYDQYVPVCICLHTVCIYQFYVYMCLE